MKAALLAAVACLLIADGSRAADKPCYQWGPNTDCLPQQVLTAPNAAGAMAAVGVPGNPLVVTSGVASQTTQPVAANPTVIATTGTYQQVFAAGTVASQGGILQTPSSDVGQFCVDESSHASAGLTTPTGGQVCAPPGSSVSFPATPGAVFVYGTKGDTLSGNGS